MAKSTNENNNSILPSFDNNNIPIVIACDNNYVPYTSVLLTSLVQNISNDYNYDVILFQKDISEENKKILLSCLNDKQNITLRFFDISNQIKSFKLRTFSYYSVEIYFRLFAPWILTAYDKVLYFDCDLVFNSDVSQLYNINIEDNYLGVVRDLGMLLHKNNPSSGIPKTYYKEFLNDINIENYFNSGVLIMNLNEFRKSSSISYIMQLIGSKKWLFPDQDVLNVMCANKTMILPSKWNTIPENSGDRTLQNLQLMVPKKYYHEYMLARKNPAIIHYAMREKPWKWSIKLDTELSLIFWKYAINSPLICEVIKTKLKFCSISEVNFILEKFGINNITEKKQKADIDYFFNNTKISSYSKKTIKFETARLDDDTLKIDGYFSVSCDEKMPTKVIFGNEKHSVECKIISKSNETIENKIINKTYVFKAELPLGNFETSDTYYLYFIVDGISIRATAYNYGRFFPTDRIFSEQYYSNGKYILKCTFNSIILFNATKKQVKNCEKKFIKQLTSIDKHNYKKPIILRKLYNLIKPRLKKQIWIVSDNFLSDDNGYAFFDYLYTNKPKNIKYYFAIPKNNKRYNELRKKLKGKLLTFGSLKYKLISLLADVKLSSIVDFNFIRPFKGLEHVGRDIYAKQKFVFLQHGVTSNDMSREHNKFNYNPTLFITTSPLEQHEIQRDCYFYDKNQIVVTGFSRFDKLYNSSKRIIAIMPTWRKYLIYKNNHKIKIDSKEFKTSNYFKFYYSLLNDKKLHKYLKKYDYKLMFVQHPLFKEFNNCFKSNTNKYIISNDKYRDIFACSNLIVSDYSSTIFDFLYLRKPIIYTHFDNTEFYSGAHAYDKGFIDHEKDGFGECEYTLSGTVNRIIEYIENGCVIKKKYLDKVNNFFAYDDFNNCERIYNQVLSLTTKNHNTKKTFRYYVKQFFKIKKQYGLKVAIKWTKAHFKRIKQENSGK